MMRDRFSRRVMLGLAAGSALALSRRVGRGQGAVPDWSLAPIGWPDRIPGDGFRIGHGFACENTWFAAGWWHTGEDWYSINGDTAGASVYAIAGGVVVYADFSYPGRVVIVQHEDDLFSMYGHLETDSVPEPGREVAAGEQIGTVFQQAAVKGPGQAPSHLHFEVRTFVQRAEVNGDSPQYGVNCGFQCPPGPGYWPMGAADHPVAIGWRNPTHAAFSRMDVSGGLRLVRNSAVGDADIAVLSAAEAGADVVGSVSGEMVLRSVKAGDPAGEGTSAEAYEAWGEVDGGWVRAAVASDFETGSDGRPSAVERPALFVARG
jgi:murein DD-endopeptidase MepM/ murein hydrolase activator NlpD